MFGGVWGFGGWGSWGFAEVWCVWDRGLRSQGVGSRLSEGLGSGDWSWGFGFGGLESGVWGVKSLGSGGLKSGGGVEVGGLGGLQLV